jgi:protein gp37
MGSAKYQTDGDPRTSGPGFGLAVHPGALLLPLGWRKPRRIFVNSMSDLFHARVPRDFIGRVWDVMARTPQHTYQILTKRPQRMNRVLRAMSGEPLPNVWLGTSVEDQPHADQRVPHLLATPAAVRFLSCEPLLGPVALADSWLYRNHAMISSSPAVHSRSIVDWVITGGESGPDYRPADPDWFRSIRDQCVSAGVAYLHKQNGGRTPKSTGRHLDGRTWDEYPTGR